MMTDGGKRVDGEMKWFARKEYMGRGKGKREREKGGISTFMIIFETRTFGLKTISFISSSSSGS